MEYCATYMCEGLVFEILRRLPAKSVIRFMVVCRLWKSIITSPQFRLLSKPKFLMHTGDRGFCTLVEEENHHHHHHDRRLIMSETDCCSYGGATKLIIGIDNGLICIRITKPYFCRVIICNPFIRKHVVVAPQAVDKRLFERASGFGGTTSGGGDYKYVRLLQGHYGEKAVDIYSMKAGTWRRKRLDWEITPPLGKGEEYHEKTTSALVRGRLHWMGTCKKEILAFELEEEVFENNIMAPAVSARGLDPRCLAVTVDVTLTVIRESLAVLAVEMQLGFKSTVCVWVMEDYGDDDHVNSWWNKLCNINVVDQHFCVGRNVVHLMNNGELLLGLYCKLYGHPKLLKLVTHNSKKMETSDFGGGAGSGGGSLSSSLTGQTTGFTYKESLVLFGDKDAADSNHWNPFSQ